MTTLTPQDRKGRRRIPRVVWLPPTGRDSIDLAKVVRARSQRANAPLTKHFVRAEVAGVEPMLYRIYVGGQSGAVAVKLYLALVWRCSGAPYMSRRDSARSWAILLDLDDPTQSGARRVSAALRKLQDARLVQLDPDPGYPPTITLLSESGDGSPYEPASTRHFRSNRGGKTPSADSLYFKIPAAMWVEGYIQAFSGPALIMYLVLACEQAYLRGQWFSTEQFPERYLISAQTRAKGTAELKRAGLLQVTAKTLDETGRTVSFGRPRRRNIYRLIGSAKPGRD